MHTRLKAAVLVTGVWGASTFPIRKQLPNPFFLKRRPSLILFLVFPTFSINKCWWRLLCFPLKGKLPLFSLLKENLFFSIFIAVPPWPRLRQMATPLGTGLRVKPFNQVCNFYCDFLFIYFPFVFVLMMHCIFVCC